MLKILTVAKQQDFPYSDFYQKDMGLLYVIIIIINSPCETLLLVMDMIRPVTFAASTSFQRCKGK
jgi:hypothetical protein